MLFLFVQLKKSLPKKILTKGFLFTSINILLLIVLICIWFQSRSMLAAGEEGFPFYNLQRTLQIYSSYFYNADLGASGKFNIPRVPLFFILSLFQHIGFAGWQIEALLYLVLLLLPAIALPRLIKLLYKPYTDELGLVASLFYLCNLYVLSQVLTRFVLSLFILWAILPVFLILFIRFVSTGKLKFLLAFLVVNSIFSDVYLIISPIITLWLCAFLLVPLIFYKEISKKRVFFRVLILILLWFVINSWWLIPFWVLRKESGAASINPSINIASLREVSKYFPSQELLLLKQSFLYGMNGRIFYLFYQKILMQSISIIVLLIALAGIFSNAVSLWFKKDKKRLKKQAKVPFLFYTLGYLFENGFYFYILFFLGWFVSKGTNPPFGDWFYSFVFKYISILQIFRNPYEKFGLVFVLGYSFFFAVGSLYIANIFKRFKYIILFGLLVVTCGYFLKPLWNGNLFTNYNRIIVPSYYQQTDSLIVSHKKSDLRILQLPLLHFPAVAYNWGYQGEEPSEFLFTNPSLSRVITNDQIDWFYNQLDRPDVISNNTYFTNYLRLLHVGYIIIHHDELATPYYHQTVAETQSYLRGTQGISYEKTVGNLEVYSVSNPGQIIYLSNSIKGYTDKDDLVSQVVSSRFIPGKDVLLQHIQDGVFKEVNKDVQIPAYKIIKISASSYRIEIKDVKNPYILVLSNNYSIAWRAIINNKIVSNHFSANGFANGWLIDKKGTYDIHLVFTVWPWE